MDNVVNPAVQEVSLAGLATVPDRYTCPDGQLWACSNLVYDHGALRPVPQPVDTGVCVPLDVESAGRCRLLGVHRDVSGGGSDRWLYASRSGVYYTVGDEDPMSDADRHYLPDVHADARTAMSVVGNTVVLSRSGDVRYLLWCKLSDDPAVYGYKDLGNHLPELDGRFGLVYGGNSSEEFDFDNVVYLGFVLPNDQGVLQDQIQDAIYPEILKYIAKTKEKGRLIFPFFARFAYRLFDGSVTMASEPVLLLPSTRQSPYVNVKIGEGDTHIKKARVIAHEAALTFNIFNGTALADYADIVSAVEIYISAPVYSLVQDGRKHDHPDFVPNKMIAEQDVPDSFFIGSAVTERLADYARQFESSVPDGNWRVFPQYRSVQDIVADLCSVQNYYLVDSFATDDIAAGDLHHLSPDLAGGKLTGLVARQALPLDYDSHDAIAGSAAFVYNSRLHFADIVKTLYKGGSINRLACRNLLGHGDTRFSFFWHINDGGRVVITKSVDDTISQDIAPWLYHPNSKAFKCVIRRDRFNTFGGTIIATDYMQVELKPHAWLNGAYWIPDGALPSVRDFADKPSWWVSDASRTDDPVVTADAVVRLPNKVYVSEVSNPFVFPVQGIVTVGTGTVLGLSTAAKAMSQGQFGQFPMYAFTDEGIWAMEVGATGTYSARQPISRDVCVNPETITQIDTAVVFVSSRGLMLLEGSNVVCLSDELSASDDTEGVEGIEGLVSPGEFPLADAKVLYGYGRSMLYVYVPKRQGGRFGGKSLVYSLRSKSWGMMDGAPDYSVASYPESLAVMADGQVVDYGGRVDSEGTTYAYVVTRPLKLGAPDALKRLKALAVRGVLPRHVGVVVYGSRDCTTWHVIGSSTNGRLPMLTGTAYKYFCVSVSAELAPGGCLSRLSCTYVPWHRGRLW